MIKTNPKPPNGTHPPVRFSRLPADCEHDNDVKLWGGGPGNVGPIMHTGWLCTSCGRVRPAVAVTRRRRLDLLLLAGLLFIAAALLLVGYWLLALAR